MTILEKNIQALLSGVNEPLGNKLLNFIQNKTCSRFNIDENLNIYDKTHNVFMYENLEEEINFFYQSILEKTPRYPFICIYGIGNALLIKNLAKHYKHLFVFESEIELFILALSVLDLSEELCSGKIYLVDIEEERVDIQLLILFDMKDMFEYLSLYEMFVNNVYYKKFYEDIWHKADELCEKNIEVIVRNLNSSLHIAFECYSHLLQNIPSMLESIPFQRILNERKNKFENAIVVSAGPSLAKQLSLLKAYQDKAVIFCADGALSMLEKEGIIPDYVTNLDCRDLAMKFFQNKENKTSLNVLSCATHPSLVHFLDNKSVVLRDDPLYQRFNLNDFGYIDTGTHVSHFSYTLALALGFKNIIMIGQDLAFDEEGNSHSKGFSYGEQFSGEKTVPTLKAQAYAGKGDQDKAVIFCADGALSMLEKEGIIPDYVTNLDFTDLAMKFFQNKENLKQSIIALECATHPNIVRSLNAENCMIVLRNKALYQRFNLNDFGYIDTGTHVSHFSYT
ncbi:motility associated factor glycosyltransferase family protein, partial [Campylobacter coli]|uniref:motility associated factor glycosyltransferase family protein n=1 Tax=Campylobacter coli TaxID=195 RepID=UPI0009E41012